MNSPIYHVGLEYTRERDSLCIWLFFLLDANIVRVWLIHYKSHIYNDIRVVITCRHTLDTVCIERTHIHTLNMLEDQLVVKRAEDLSRQAKLIIWN